MIHAKRTLEFTTSYRAPSPESTAEREHRLVQALRKDPSTLIGGITPAELQQLKEKANANQ